MKEAPKLPSCQCQCCEKRRAASKKRRASTVDKFLAIAAEYGLVVVKSETNGFEIENMKPIREFPKYSIVPVGNSAVILSPTRQPIKIKVSENGYETVTFFNENRVRSRRVHRLIWEYFNGQIPDSLQVNHKDGNKLNNSIGNLEIVSKEENVDHAIRTGLSAHMKPVSLKNKLTGEVRHFSSRGDASRFLGFDRRNLYGLIKDKSKSYKGWVAA